MNEEIKTGGIIFGIWRDRGSRHYVQLKGEDLCSGIRVERSMTRSGIVADAHGVQLVACGPVSKCRKAEDRDGAKICETYPL